MRKLTIIFLSLLQILFAVNSKAQWRIEKCPTSHNLNSVSFSAGGFGFIVGEKGTILQRTGAGWVLQSSPTKEDLYSVYMIDRNDAWAVGAKGTIIHYNGSDWRKAESPAVNDLFSVSFRDHETGVAVGRNGTMVFYSGGKWNQAVNYVRSDFFASVYIGNEIVAGGGMEYLNVPLLRIKNNDPVNSEEMFTSNMVVTGVAFSSPDNGWITGSPSTLIHYNSRNLEKMVFEERYPTMKSVAVSGDSSAICAGYNGTILFFSKEGWKKEIALTTENLNGTAITEGRFYAVGNKGTILSGPAAGNDGDKWVKTDADPLIDIYPNPNRGSFNLVIKGITNTLPVTVSVLQVDGRSVAEKVLYPSGGIISTSFDIPDPGPGLYSVKASAGEKILYSKFIVN